MKKRKFFEIGKMNEEYAKDISTWRYPYPFDNYSFTNDDFEMKQLLNGLHFPAILLEDKSLSGYIAIGPSAQIRRKRNNYFYDDESYTDIALGLRPSICGKGLGKYLLEAAIDFARKSFPGDGVRLTVEARNKRALYLYKKAGFRRRKSFKRGLFRSRLIIMTIE